MTRKFAFAVVLLAVTTVATMLLSSFSVESLLGGGRLATTPSRSDVLVQVQQTKRSYDQGEIQPYDQSNLEALFHEGAHDFQVALLVFDGKEFLSYDIGAQYSHTTMRTVRAIPLLVNTLKAKFPSRFQPGQPVFQLAWTVSDFLATACVNGDVRCESTKHLPPLITFGSVYKNDTILPTTKAFPNPFYITCLYVWRIHGAAPCKWAEVDQTLKWDDLIPTMVWRGSDFRHFLHSYTENKEFTKPWFAEMFTEKSLAGSTKMGVVDKLFDNYSKLTPRWRAVALTLRRKVSQIGKVPWIDAMFTGNFNKESHSIFAERGVPVSESVSMNETTMSKYRYQIDLGGGGGTTWQGTLSKLQMPGVLFHHETQTKDWFYDMMEPWKHYIPVKGDLSNLWVRYRWAEENPEMAKHIAQESTKLAEYLLSSEYMEKVYTELFVEYLGKVVYAYQPEKGASWKDCLERYERQKVGVYNLSECNERDCITEVQAKRFLTVKHTTEV